MTATQEWTRLLARAPQLRATTAFVVERPDRRRAEPPLIGVPKRLRLTEELERELLRRTRERLSDQYNSRVLPYNPGHRPELGEIVSVPVADVIGLRELCSVIHSDELQEFDGDAAERRHLLLYGVALGRDPEGVVCIQQFTARQELKTDKLLLMIQEGAVYNRLAEGGFAFDLNFDLFVSGQYAFASDTRVLEHVIGYLESVRAEARQHAQMVADTLPVANVAEFIAACERDARFARKVAAIVQRPGFAHLTMDELRRHAAHHGIDLAEDGNGRLVFSNASGERWVLLKLLDDDYLDSLLTGARYEVNSKIPK